MTDLDTGLPVANVELAARPPNGRQVSWARTDRDGTYDLTGLPAGTIEVEVRGRGYIEQHATVRLEDSREIPGIDFALKLGATISGRVIDAATGLPIPNMEARAEVVDGMWLDSTRTDGEGRYVLRGIPDGEIEVSVDGQGYVEVRRTVTVSDGQDVVDFDF